MAADADTFTRFVDLVSAQLDEQGAHGDELASRLHLSRSQLDRVVKAAAGEPAGRFRRRILPERAAYRLVTGDVGVLDVAVEAGYSSHEAFTRAFRRTLVVGALSSAGLDLQDDPLVWEPVRPAGPTVP
ncbi:MAG: helix-turn-helix domain-containing protein [Nocardioidaceae bacterium]